MIDFELNAVRDQRGSLTLPIGEDPGFPSRLTSVCGVAEVSLKVLPKSSVGVNFSFEEIEKLVKLMGEQVELRCPVADMMSRSGCEMRIEWKLKR